MIKNKFGEIVYNIEDVVDLIMKQQSTAGITVDGTVQLEDTSPETDISLSVDEYDMMNQRNWLMPEEYKQMDIIDISLRSTFGGGVSYLHGEEESVGPFEADGWWNQNTPVCSKTKITKKKVVTLDNPTWKSIDLDWNDTTDQEETIIEVKLEKKTEKVDNSSENVVEFKPNDKK